ncbi:MAG: LPXTG cell wall anchor domain-containing protein [Ilumatobacteraceae bacterium]
MKKMLIGATTALTALAMTGGVASAQDDGDGAYTFPPNNGVEGETICVDVEGGTPTLEFEIESSGAKTSDLSYALRFVRDGSSFASPVSVSGPSGTIDFPTENGYLNDGWTDEDGLLFPGPTIVGDDGVSVIAEVTDEGDGDALYTSAAAAVTLDDTTCVASQPPPTSPTIPPPATVPPAQQPPPGPSPQAPLPATGISTFESSMRAGALLMIAGLGFVIVARRRRFASTTASN